MYITKIVPRLKNKDKERIIIIIDFSVIFVKSEETFTIKAFT